MISSREFLMVVHKFFGDFVALIVYDSEGRVGREALELWCEVR
jgi:hypothetical protein